MTTATAPGTPPPTTQPAVPAPPSKGATIAEHMEAKRRAIRAKAPDPEPESGAGGGGTVESAAPAQPVEPANDNAGKGEGAKPETPDKPDPAKAEEERRAAARAEREQQRKVVREAIALRDEKRKLKQMRADQEARETRIKQAEAERAELEDLRKKDPVAYARRMGFTVRELAERDLQDEKAKPKVPLEDLPQEVRDELEANRKYREEQEAEKKAWLEQEKAAARAKAKEAGERDGQAFIAGLYGQEKADYPHLANYYNDETIVAAAWAIVDDHFEATCSRDPKTGDMLDDGETLDLRQVLGYMEENARKEREKFSKPLPPKGVPDRASREASQASNPEPTTMSQSDAASGAPVKRVEDMQQRRDRIRKRRS